MVRAWLLRLTALPLLPNVMVVGLLVMSPPTVVGPVKVRATDPDVPKVAAPVMLSETAAGTVRADPTAITVPPAIVKVLDVVPKALPLLSLIVPSVIWTPP